MLTEIAIAGTAAGLTAGGYAYSAMWPTSQIFGRTIVAGTNPQEIALTYDDGPNDSWTPRLLEVLAKHNVRATFFLIGRFVRQRPQIARALHEAGHLVCNHSMTHPNLATIRPALVLSELTACNKALEDTLGATVRYFRPPFGARRPDVLRTARSLGLTPVMWNVTCYDWEAGIPADRILRHAEQGIARNQRRDRGSNLLLHDGGQAGIGQDRAASVAATDSLLTHLAEARRASRNPIRFVTADAWDSANAIKP